MKLPIYDRVILDLCGGTGSWSEPYRKAGYDVRVIDLVSGWDVLKYDPRGIVIHGILAAPPRTHFSVSGARWWKGKGAKPIVEGLRVVHACQRIIRRSGCQWWALENPVGRLSKYIGPYVYSFQPWEYGDPWFKRTCIWGQFARPSFKADAVPPVKHAGGQRRRNSLTNHLSPTPTAGQIARLVQTGMLPPDWIHRLGPSPERATLRAITPPSFARAFFTANP